MVFVEKYCTYVSRFIFLISNISNYIITRN